jgi:hypothetical protein
MCRVLPGGKGELGVNVYGADDIGEIKRFILSVNSKSDDGKISALL